MRKRWRPLYKYCTAAFPASFAARINLQLPQSFPRLYQGPQPFFFFVFNVFFSTNASVKVFPRFFLCPHRKRNQHQSSQQSTNRHYPSILPTTSSSVRQPIHQMPLQPQAKQKHASQVHRAHFVPREIHSTRAIRQSNSAVLHKPNISDHSHEISTNIITNTHFYLSPAKFNSPQYQHTLYNCQQQQDT